MLRFDCGVSETLQPEATLADSSVVSPLNVAYFSSSAPEVQVHHIPHSVPGFALMCFRNA